MGSKSWALITGASSGIGEATAKALAAQGYSIFLLARREERLKKLAASLAKEFPKQSFEPIGVDVTDRKAIDKFVKSNQKELKSLELLINNAGLAKGADKFQDGKISEWDEMIQVNVMALLYLTRSLLPFMISKKAGHIVNLGSVAGRWTYVGGAVYCASKFAVRAISEALRLDLMGTAIRVSNIEPGMVNTEFSTVRFGDKGKADKVYAGMKPLTATDIAETIFWVVARPKHVNIQEIVIFPTDQAAIRDVHRS
jgi:3-hydroxy acid dehydrogenase/malonic semialdehyde reductase